jgi:hypothetical protein
VKCAAAFEYSYLTLNRTDEGFQVRLPSNHKLTAQQEKDLRAYALANQDVFDDVITERKKAPRSPQCQHQGAEEEAPQQSEDQQANELINGLGQWAKEMS